MSMRNPFRARPPAVALAALLSALAAPPVAAQTQAAYEDLQARIIEVSERVTPSVVHIQAISLHNDRRRQVTGSGFIVSRDGTILTNEHVVEKAEKVTVTVPGRKPRYPATVIGTDKQTDIGVIRIDPDAGLPVADIGDSDALRVGQWVLAIGNPYGLEGTVSFGIVSAKGRNLEVDQLLNDFIQTDAMIDRGSSGGPLVDLDGRVVGINSRGQGRGIGFTIPIRTALDVMEQIQAGRIERGWLGVTVQPLDRELAGYFGIPEVTGVVVNSVGAGSPAERAGVRAGDVVAELDGAPLEAEQEEDLGAFQRAVAALDPGHKARLVVVRDGRRKPLEVEIGVAPKVVPEEARSEAGFHVQEITDLLFRSERLVSRQGAYVSYVERGSPAFEAGLRRGDVIDRIERRRVEDLKDFRRAIRTADDQERFLLTARRGDETKFLLVKPRAERQPEAPEGDPDPAPAGDVVEDPPR
jgi:Do/DeqQ family serine protease